jgi:hypothetical protein
MSMPFFSVPTFEYIRRPRGSGRNRRLGDSSEISDEHLDSDSEENTDDHVDSLDMQSTLGSEDVPVENPRPGRDARTRAKVTPILHCYSSR